MTGSPSIREIFLAARSRPPTERATYLTKACGGDAKLRARVDALLEVDHDAEEFWPGLLREGPTESSPAGERPGDTIGRFELRRQIGEGGFGTVWLADQREPVRRQVALKVIKLGMDTQQVIARFDAERQALALMDHPNIAKVLDGGVTPGGRPFFVMELVDGKPITEYCDSAGLATAARLALFQEVCNAVQHAHQKGVIHRDLKPSNILVAEVDGRPVPKVIDFGIAKATSIELTKRTLVTGAHQLIGTPEYMAPEQADLTDVDVDTRADIYSLGVLLYEMLTGTRPFDVESLAERGYLEVLRVIREEEPPVPSSRISTLGAESDVVASSRGTTAKSLGRRIRGDLDWIVMRALEKDRNRRYRTANDLAEDIGRHLDDEPVLAGPPSASYRLRKYVRRHRVGVLVGTFAILALLAVTVVSLWFSNELEHKNEELVRTLVSTRALGLAGAAQEEVRSDPTRATLLALEAVRLEERIETRSALHRAVAHCAERLVIRPPGSTICTDVLPDGSRILTGNADGEVRLWSRSGELLWMHPLRENTTAESRRVVLAMFLDTDRVLVGNNRGDVHLLDLRGALLDTFVSSPRSPIQGSNPSGANRAGDRVVIRTVGAAQLLAIDGPTRDRLRLVQELPIGGILKHVAFHPTGDWLATWKIAAARGQLWRRRGSGKFELAGPILDTPERALSLGFSGTRLLVGLKGRPNLALDLPLGGGVPERTEFGADTETAVGLDGGRKVVGTRLGAGFTIFDASLEVETPAQESTSLVTQTPASVSRDGHRFALLYQDGTIRVYDLHGRLEATLRGHVTMATRVEFINGDRELFSAEAGTVRIWSLSDQGLGWRLSGRLGVLIRRSPTGEHLLSQSTEVQLWTAEREIVFSTSATNGWAECRFPFSSDGKYVAVVHGPDLKVFDTSTGALIRTLRETQHRHGPYCFLPHTREILRFGWARGRDSSVLDVASGETKPGPAATGMVWSVAPSPSGRRVVVAQRWAKIATAVLFERTGADWRQLARAEIDSGVRAIAYSPDGEQILLGTDGARILSFDKNLTPRTEEFVGHRQRISDVRFSPDGGLVLSTSADGTARLWHRDGSPIAVLENYPGQVGGGDFTPDGRQVLTAHPGGFVAQWFVETADLIEAARTRLSRIGFREEERQRFAQLLAR